MKSSRADRRTIAAAALAWVPPAALAVVRLAWASPPAVIPSHWSGAGPANAFSPSGDVFAVSMIAAVVAAIIAGLIAAFAAGIDPIRRAVLLAALNLLGALIGLVWVVASLTAVQAATGGTTAIGAPFLLFLVALLWGVLAGAITGPFRRT
ncbi:hypothetical protein [Sinomonas sp. P47F7]|uniref:hypothetical protein n=1 Tax=Sinomonas sp. P47F7 TaxID=3410987 RepID=UPI003BF529CF